MISIFTNNNILYTYVTCTKFNCQVTEMAHVMEMPNNVKNNGNYYLFKYLFSNSCKLRLIFI